MSRPSILNSIERKFILFLGDLLLITVAINLFINHAIDRQFLSGTLQTFLFVFGIITFILLSYVLDFYNLEKVGKKRYIITQSIYITAFHVLLIFVTTVLVFDVSFWRIPLLSFLFLTPLQIGLWRFFFGNVFKIIPITKKVLFIYENTADLEVKEEIDFIDGKEMETFYKVKLTYSMAHDNLFNKNLFLNAANKVDAVIINIDNYDLLGKELREMLINAILSGKEVISFSAFYENTYEALPFKPGSNSYYEILQLRNIKIRGLQRIFTFLINFSLSLVLGLVFIVVTPFVWLLNLLFNRGPLFYSQKRIGQHGKEFIIYKFRSMVVDAEKAGAAMAKKGDARVTPFGKILRMFRIDELPQVLSIIKGDMQFIGPRPERKVFVEKLNEITPFYNTRHLIKPGITGWAQVKYRYGQNLEDSIRKLEYDLYYIKNKSITLDLRIIFKTVTTVLFSRGV